MSERSKPAYKWAIWIFLVAYAVACYQQGAAISLSPSSTAAIGYIFIPISGAITALPFAGIGYAIGSLIRAWQTRLRRHVIIASVAALLSVAYVAFMVIDAAHDRQLAATITRIEKLTDPELATLLDNDTDRTNRYVLAAVAMHPDASSKTLARIAAIDDQTLHERFGGSSELMGANRREYAVMRLVALNPNVSPETLVLLSHSPDAYVLGDVARNQATPIAVLERLYLERNDKGLGGLIELGLASNTETPEIILRELATNSQDPYMLEGIERNPSAPNELKIFVRERIKSGDY